MSELTDLELCKKIADLEGVNVSMKKVMSHKEGICQRLLDDEDCSYWPLTDKGSLFDLMVKHGAYFQPDAICGGHFVICGCEQVYAKDVSELPRAILECIIKANPSA